MTRSSYSNIHWDQKYSLRAALGIIWSECSILKFLNVSFLSWGQHTSLNIMRFLKFYAKSALNVPFFPEEKDWFSPDSQNGSQPYNDDDGKWVENMLSCLLWFAVALTKYWVPPRGNLSVFFAFLLLNFLFKMKLYPRMNMFLLSPCCFCSAL